MQQQQDLSSTIRDSSTGEQQQHWDIVLEPRNSFFKLNLAEVWRYRDLMWLFVRRDFIAQYKQTVLGPLWHIIQPLLTTMMFLFLFGKVAKIGTDGIEPVLFYMSGITIWNYFATCLTNTSATFISNAAIFGKVYFPRLVLPLSIVISNIIRLGIQFGLLLVFMLYYLLFKGVPIELSVYWLYIPLIILVMAGIGLGLGIIISSLTTRYRDLALLLAFAVQLGMYATPVAYPLSYLSGTKYKWLIAVNPLSSIVEAFRFCLFGKGTVTMDGLLYSLCFMVVVLAAGILLFNKVEKDFMDTV